MKSILVTGGAGYIGSHVAKVLACAGYIPVVIDNLSLGHRQAAKFGPFVEGDISNRALVKKTLEAYEIKDVIHLAAKAYVDESVLQSHYGRCTGRPRGLLGAATTGVAPGPDAHRRFHSSS